MSFDVHIGTAISIVVMAAVIAFMDWVRMRKLLRFR
jgi:hypothetical protein